MSGRLTVGTAKRAAVNQTVCGDECAVALGAARSLVCVADGLGHGPDAHAAATVACSFAVENARLPLETLLRQMDRALAATRGAAVALVVLDVEEARVQFAGTGNVELRSVSRASIAPPSAPGIVGRGLRSVRVWDYALALDDLLVLTTDGISSRFELAAYAHLPPQELAGAILAAHHKTHDDACCVAVRVGGA